MRLTYNWLREYVDCDLLPQELTESLTMAGIEVAAVEETDEEFQGIVTGKILSLRPHREAEHLLICTTDIGTEKVPIVCGAPNINSGDMVPVALPGAVLPDGTHVEKTQIRGELSVGMLCSADELTLMDDTYGIYQLDKSLKPGINLADAIGFDDTVLELNITPNRGDCLSVTGVAREVAAITGAPFSYPDFKLEEEGRPAELWTSVELLEPELCPRYTARIISGIKIKASPLWMQLRLKAAGMRPLNNIVDITNYVMLELGQPLHAFDYHLLRENRIVVRRAEKGELLVTLDGKARTLDDTMLVIADARKSIALAGIMGGQESEVTDESRDILLEAAHFDPLNNRKTAKKLGANTEASYRFQRYVDPRGTALAADRAACFMATMGEGKVAPGTVDEWPLKREKTAISIRTSRTNQVLGTDFEQKEVARYLQRLQLGVSEANQDTLSAEIPSYRSDLTREIDLVEEVARLYGYQKINSSIPYARTALKNPMALTDPVHLAREILVEAGFMEIISYNFLSEKALDRLLIPSDDPRREVVTLRNPLTQDWTCMRTTMLPGLLNTILFNFNRNNFDLKLFEMGRIYLQTSQDTLPRERTCLSAAVTGLRDPGLWSSKRKEVDFFDLKGPLEAILEKLRCENVKFEKATEPYFRAACSANIVMGNETIGTIGEINSRVLESFDIPRKVVFFEIDLDKIAEYARKEPPRFHQLPKFPSVTRDIALVLGEGTPAAEVVKSIQAIAPPILKQVNLFDFYIGKQVPSGQKSLAFSLVFQAEDRTLVNEEVNSFMEMLVTHLKESLGATLR